MLLLNAKPFPLNNQTNRGSRRIQIRILLASILLKTLQQQMEQKRPTF